MIEQENMFTLLSIEAWRDCEGGWIWNNCFTVEEDIHLEYSQITPRKLFKALRELGYLSEESKGRVALNDTGYYIEILDRSTLEPIFAFRPQWPM